MAVGLGELPVLHPVAGVRLGTARAGIRRPDRRDLVLLECAADTVAAAVFTRNRFCAAPVLIAQRHLATTAPRALLINTGFANAGTGAEGEADALDSCAAAAAALKLKPEQILPFSTGVIGERLPLDKLTAGLPQCIATLDAAGWHEAAYGIMTTDTVPKAYSRQFDIDGRTVTITGIAKGSGMIRPDMATMLAFVATDARVAPAVLQRCLTTAVGQSFNRITVDGDTSTNDACVLLATGKAGVVLGEDSTGLRVFTRELNALLLLLAQAIIRDGEGATKFITVDVRGGASEHDCLEVAYTIAHSPLVKTAFFASDPNWGRILAAIGRAPIAQLDIARIDIYLGEACIVRNGARAPTYREADGQAAMRHDEITIRVELNAGEARTQIWTSDLSHDYVKINAEYRS